MKVFNLKSKRMHVCFPIGATSLHSQERLVAVEAGGSIELNDADAEKLIRLDRQLDLPEEKRTKTDSSCWTWGYEGEKSDNSTIPGGAFVPACSSAPEGEQAEKESTNVADDGGETDDPTEETKAKGSKARGSGNKRGR